MQIEIGNKLRTLRNQLGYTQETIAELCNVSNVAVSKWENGISYPDISILPILARIFDISIDELLNFEKELKVEDIPIFAKQALEHFQKDSFEEAFNFSKELIKTYPNSEALKLKVAGNWMYVMMYVCDEEKMKAYMAFAKQLFEQLQHSTTYETRYIACVQLHNFYCMEEEYEKAENILNALPKNSDVNTLLGTLYMQQEKYDKAKEHIQSMLYHDTLNLCLNITNLSTLAKKEQKPEEIQVYGKLLKDVQDLMHYHNAIAFSPMNKDDADKKTALKHVSDYVNNLLHYDDYGSFIQDELSKTLWFKHVPIDPNKLPKGLMKGKISILLKDANFDYLRDEEEFKRIEEEVRIIEDKQAS